MFDIRFTDIFPVEDADSGNGSTGMFGDFFFKILSGFGNRYIVGAEKVIAAAVFDDVQAVAGFQRFGSPDAFVDFPVWRIFVFSGDEADIQLSAVVGKYLVFRIQPRLFGIGAVDIFHAVGQRVYPGMAG